MRNANWWHEFQVRIRLCRENPDTARLECGDWAQEFGHQREQLLRNEL